MMKRQCSVGEKAVRREKNINSWVGQWMAREISLSMQWKMQRQRRRQATGGVSRSGNEVGLRKRLVGHLFYVLNFPFNLVLPWLVNNKSSRSNKYGKCFHACSPLVVLT
jgi:hypothetical protein